MVWLCIAGLLLVAIVAVFAARPRFLTCGPRSQIRGTLLWYSARLITRFVHKVRYVGLEHVPKRNDEGPLLIVSNHTGSADPMLLQAPLPTHIRWMMATDTMSPEFDWFWKWLEIIPVTRRGRDSGPAREAIRYLKQGGIVGIFPEGGIENPPGEIRPFLEGVGLILAKSKAPVLLAWISGTAFRKSMLGSIFTPCRARVEFLGRFEFTDEERADPQELIRRLREAIAERSGWPLNDAVLPSARQDRATSAAAPS